MKIGILTHPLIDNYGGLLQAWAMQTVLKKLGAESEIFIVKAQKRHIFILPLAIFKRSICKLLGKYDGDIFHELNNYLSQKKQNKHLIKFIKNNYKLKNIKTVEYINQGNYDAIIVGSDQIWRKCYIKSVCNMKHITDAFLYPLTANLKKISYAASFGVDNWEYTLDETSRIKDALSKFNAISVREISGINLLRNNIAANAKWVLDPTMLIEPDEYKNLVAINGGASCNNSGKIVSYILDASPEKESLINRIIQDRCCGHIELKQKNNGTKTSMQDWISSIYEASIVVTDSFHGCVFSIIFNKPLVFVLNQERGNTRFDTLIEKFNLENNLVSKDRPYSASSEYLLPDDINTRLNLYKKESLTFLADAIL